MIKSRSPSPPRSPKKVEEKKAEEGTKEETKKEAKYDRRKLCGGGFGVKCRPIYSKSVVPHADGSLQSVTLLYLRVPIRLGDDVFIKGKISEEKETELLQMFKAVCHLLKLCNVSCFRACATSSMREAKTARKW